MAFFAAAPPPAGAPLYRGALGTCLTCLRLKMVLNPTLRNALYFLQHGFSDPTYIINTEISDPTNPIQPMGGPDPCSSLVKTRLCIEFV